MPPRHAPRVLHVIGNTNIGGVTRLLAAVLPRLGPEFDVRVCCTGNSDNAELFTSRGLEFIRCPVRGRLGPAGLWRLVRLFRRVRPEIVNTHEYPMGITGVVAGRLAGVKRIVSHVHRMHHCFGNPRRKLQERIVSRMRDCTVFVSRAAMDAYSVEVGRLGGRCAVIPNGVDPEPRLPPRERGDLRRLLGIDEDAKLVVGVGSLAAGKGFGTFLDAAARAMGRVPTAAAVIVGDGKERVSLERRAAELGVSERVVFTGRREDAARLVGIGDVFLNASESEGAFPLVLIEAIAAGLPVVSTNLPSVVEVVEAAEGGGFATLFDVGDAEGAARALVRVLTDPKLASRMRHSALRHARMFEAGVCAGNLKRVYRSILTRPPRR